MESTLAHRQLGGPRHQQAGWDWVDGKRKKIQLVKGDTQGKPAIAKAVAERLCLDDKVDVLWGITGSHLALAIQQVAGRNKAIFVIHTAYSDQLMDGRNFNRYTFRACWTTTMAAQGLAYFFSQRPERRFYLFCQDYLFGHDLAEAFKKGLKKYKPNAEIVGEDYHPLWTKDFAPYLTKIKGSQAEVIVTGDWDPDAGTLLKQARELGIKLPFAHLFMSDPNVLLPVGPSGSVGLLHIDSFLLDDETPGHHIWLHRWNDQWKRWKKPYNTPLYKWPQGGNAAAQLSLYWLLDVIRRAGSTDPEKIIKTWEGDEWTSLAGPLKMRACDHQTIMDLYATEFVYPNKWQEGCAHYGKIIGSGQVCHAPGAGDLERCRK